MKFEGVFKGIPVYSSPDVPTNIIYMINDKDLEIDYPLRKDGKPDMRYRINRILIHTKYT